MAHTTDALASLGRHPEPDVELGARSLEFVLEAVGPQPHEALQAYRATFQRLAEAQVPPLTWALAAPLILRICLALGERHFAREFADAVAAHCPDPGERALLRALLLLDAGKADAARQALETIVRGGARCHLVTTEVRARLLVAELDHLSGRTVRAHEQLVEALHLAAPLGLLRPFCERPAVLELLQASRGRFGLLEPFVDDLLAPAIPTTVAEDDACRLTPRELADAHAVSINNTIKTHVRGVYRKLGVTGSRDAVVTGRRRGLL